MVRIPRSREVAQSWTTTLGTTALALLASVRAVVRFAPDLVLCNGPGTCVPVCAAAYVPRLLGIKHVHIVYVESFCRVRTLSLTGRLLRPFADRFIVAWPSLRDRYPAHAEYLGRLF